MMLPQNPDKSLCGSTRDLVERAKDLTYSDRKYLRGLTLIELLIVISLLSVIATTTLPDFNKFVKHLWLENTVQDIVNLMRYAQGRAITDGRQLRLILDEDTATYWLAPARSDVPDLSKEIYKRIPGRWGRVFKIPSTFALSSDLQEINFYPNGRIDRTRLSVCQKSECLLISSQWQRGRIEISKDARQ